MYAFLQTVPLNFVEHHGRRLRTSALALGKNPSKRYPQILGVVVEAFTAAGAWKEAAGLTTAVYGDIPGGDLWPAALEITDQKTCDISAGSQSCYAAALANIFIKS